MMSVKVNPKYSMESDKEWFLGTTECSHIVEDEITGERVGIELQDDAYDPCIVIYQPPGHTIRMPIKRQRWQELYDAIGHRFGFTTENNVAK
jgi:hypothetical protein